MRNKAIVIHYLGDGLSATARPLKKRWINSSGKISYDYGIESDGSAVVGRSLNVRGAHAIAEKQPYISWPNKIHSAKWGWYSDWFNRNAIGVVVCEGKGDPLPDVMYQGLIKLIKELVDKHSIPAEKIFYHCDIFNTSCPGWLKGQKDRLLNDIFKEATVDSNRIVLRIFKDGKETDSRKAKDFNLSNSFFNGGLIAYQFADGIRFFKITNAGKIEKSDGFMGGGTLSKREKPGLITMSQNGIEAYGYE